MDAPRSPVILSRDPRDPRVDPDDTPVALAVAVFELPVVHVALDVTSSFVPSGSVASADICTESVRPTAHGDGETAIADTVDDEFEEPPQATEATMANPAKSPSVRFVFMIGSLASIVPLGKSRIPTTATTGRRTPSCRASAGQWSASPTAERTHPMLRRLEDLENYAVSATDGAVGKVVRYLLDDLRWVVSHLVVEPAVFFDRTRVPISPALVHRADWAARRYHLSLTKAAIKSGTNIALDVPAEVVHLRNCSEVRGCEVHGSDDGVGTISDLVVDDESWEIRYLVVDTNRWRFGKKALVAPEWVTQARWDEKRVDLSLARHAVTDSPPWDACVAIHREYETRLYDYYGRPRRGTAGSEPPTAPSEFTIPSA